MVQLVHPTATVFNIGGGTWSATGAATTWEAVDEASASPNDSDYISAADAAATILLALGSATNPGDDLNHRIMLRARVTGGPASAQVRVALFDDIDATLTSVGESFVTVDTSWTTYQLDLPADLAQQLTDYAHLGVALQFTGWTSGATLQVSLVEMAVPDPLDIRTSRVVVEVMAGSSLPDFRVSRLSVEVMGRSGNYCRVSRIAVEVMAAAAGGSPAGADVRVSRVGVEVMARHDASVVKPDARASRLSVEVMARSDAAPVVEPLPLPAELPPVFLANWIQAVSVRTGWSTAVTESDDVLREDRFQLLDRPLRTIEVLLTGLGPDESRALLGLSWHRASQRGPFPLYSDHARVTAAPSSTSLQLDTRTRRFFPGARIMVVHFEANRPVDPQYARIASVDSSGLTLEAPGVTAAAGHRVYPVIDAEVSLETGEQEYEGTRCTSIRVVAREAPGPSALPGLTRIAGPMTYRGAPIFLPPIDWNDAPSMAVFRSGESFESGLVQVVYPRGVGPRMSFSVRALGLSRAAIWPTLKLLDGRRGRARRLWAINPGTLLEVTDVTPASVVAQVDEDHDNLAQVAANVRYLGIVYTDGTADVRAISSIDEMTAGGLTYWGFNLAELIGTSKPVHRVGFAHLSRSSQDYVEETWGSMESCSSSFSVVEVPK